MAKLIQFKKDDEQVYPNIVVQSGDSENGYWVKYADGTMICQNRIIVSAIGMNPEGALYRTNTIPFPDFPQPFTEIPIVTFSPDDMTSPSGYFWLGKWGGSSYGPTNINPGRVILIKASSTAFSGSISYIATGKWK